MALPEHVLRHKPAESWWTKATREEFMAERNEQLPRMKLVGCYVATSFDNEAKHANRMTTLPKQRVEPD